MKEIISNLFKETAYNQNNYKSIQFKVYGANRLQFSRNYELVKNIKFKNLDYLI